ncbi:oligopeptide transporter [Colletotrichum higginsianum]|uniref:Oligopeptide transporter n=1 Tax=Colletotrichum higginsianum (strain IMI 349063) TaxID=759273 RepID=H1V8N3_COLHI|nr:oligopeptide transporter [Colletotrichum higginsianum]
MTDQVGRADGPDLTGPLEKSGPGDLEKADDNAGQPDESPATKDLPRVADRIPNAAWLVMLLTMAERFSFYGMTTPFMNYMQNGRGDPLRPGALGWGQSRASQVSNVFNIISWLTPMASGIVADKGLGRYRTLCVTFVVYLAGTVLLTPPRTAPSSPPAAASASSSTAP